jgi:hypothetical protein
MSLDRAVIELRHAALCADVGGEFCVTLAFQSDRDLAHFERQVMEDLRPLVANLQEPGGMNGFTLYGIHVRLVSDMPPKGR